MRAWMWVGGGAAALVGLLAAAAVGTVGYIQHNDMRAWASWGAAQAGVPVTLTGPVSVQVWPKLVVKTAGVQVGALQGPGTLAEVDALALQARWGQGLRFWEGLQLQAIEAKNPSLTLVRQANGQANWERAAATPATTAATPATPSNPLAELTQTGGMLAALRLAIANLNLTYADAPSGQRIEVRGMNIGARTEGSVATTTLRGLLNQQPLSGELVADVATLADVPIKARLEGAGALLNLNGRVTAQSGGTYGFAGLINARAGNVQQTVRQLLGTASAQIPASAASVTGDIAVLPQALTLRNFSARLGDLLQARGDIDVALGSAPRGQGTLALQGANLRALAELAQGAPQPWVPKAPFTLQAKLAGENQLEVRDLALRLENLLTVQGGLSLTPRGAAVPDLDASLALSAPNFQNLWRAFGQTGPAPTQPLQATLKVAGAQGVYTLQQAEATMADVATLGANGQVTLGQDQPTVDLAVTLEGPNMATTGAAFGLGQGLPNSGFSVRSKVRGSGPYELEGLTVNLPGLLQALANLTLQPGTPTNLQGEINISQLNATRLGYCGGPTASSAGNGSSQGSAASTGGAPWSATPLALEGLRDLALNVRVQAQGLVCEGLPLSTAAFTLRNTPSQLDLAQLVLALAGGQVTGDLKLGHAGTPRLTAGLKLSRVAVEQLVPALAGRGVVLPLSGQLDLTSQGVSTLALAQNLNGLIRLQATEGQLPYGSLLGNVVALERLLQGQAQLPANGEGTLESLQLGMQFNQGTGTFAPLEAKTANGAFTLQGTGTLDLPNWAVDLTLTPQLATSAGLAVPILVRGPLTAPAIGADPAFTERLTRRLATEGVKSLLGLDKEDAKGLGGVVSDVLGGKGLTQEGVGNLLNQFVKPKPAATPAPSNPTPAAAEPPTPAETEAAAPPTPTEALEQALPGLLEGVLGQ